MNEPTFFQNLHRILSYMDIEANEHHLCKIGETEAWIIVSEISGSDVRHLLAAGEQVTTGVAFIRHLAVLDDWTMTRQREVADAATSDDV